MTAGHIIRNICFLRNHVLDNFYLFFLTPILSRLPSFINQNNYRYGRLCRIARFLSDHSFMTEIGSSQFRVSDFLERCAYQVATVQTNRTRRALYEANTSNTGAV